MPANSLTLHAAGNRAAACIVDALRAQLPPQYVDLRTIRKLLAYDASTTPAEYELLVALAYLEQRGEIQRTPPRGWRKIEQHRELPQHLAQFLRLDSTPAQLALPGVNLG